MNLWMNQALGAAAYRRWLTQGGSLTRALRAHCADFRVRRARQAVGRPITDEHQPLNIPHGRPALIREVVLYCADQALVFAHTVVPDAKLRGPWRALAKLGDRPLGAALFTDPRIVRFPMSYRHIHRHHPLHRRARDVVGTLPDRLWARRSRFKLEGQAILVTEVFLPEVLTL
jgi:chorismate--pyruvate lyase